MSDLPNFPARPWYREKRVLRAFVVTVAIMVGLAAWCLSAGTADQDIMFAAKPKSAGIKNGEPFAIEAIIKNSGVRTAQIQIQMALFMKDSACMQSGKRLANSFSLPMRVSVSPNETKSIVMQFDSVTAECSGTVGVEVFADGKMDLERFSLNRKLEDPTIKLF